jgi:hypothetical protein
VRFDFDDRFPFLPTPVSSEQIWRSRDLAQRGSPFSLSVLF